MKGDEGGIENIMLHSGPTCHAYFPCFGGVCIVLRDDSYGLVCMGSHRPAEIPMRSFFAKKKLGCCVTVYGVAHTVREQRQLRRAPETEMH